jgi:hypothetical protein
MEGDVISVQGERCAEALLKGIESGGVPTVLR